MLKPDFLPSPTLANILGVIVCAVISFNALAFSAAVAIPLPSADAWHFIESFVRPALENHLTIADFFVKRSPDDHAQPLQKLVMLADLHWTDLDFRVEAMIGIAIGVSTCSALYWRMSKGVKTVRERNLAILGGCVVFAVGLSLNATIIFSWFLVSLTWISLGLVFLYWFALGVASTPLRIFVSASLATLALGMVIDELAFPAFAALLLAIAARDGFRRPRLLLAALIGGTAGLAIARWTLQAMTPMADTASVTHGSMGALLGLVQQPDAWKLVVGPLSDSLVHAVHMVGLPPQQAIAIQVGIGVLLLVGHGYFWWRAVFSRYRPQPEVLVMAVAAMLFFYAAVAGIVLGRIPEFGVGYIHQMRYVVIFQVNIIALAMMFFSPLQSSHGSAPVHVQGTRIAVTTALAALLLQIPLSMEAWANAKYLHNFSNKAEQTLVELAADPSRVPIAGCPAILTICKAPSEDREATIELLKKHRLSIYSSRFLEANGYVKASGREPATVAAARGMFRPACNVRVENWSPKVIPSSRRFNTQPDGRSAFWLQVAPGSSDFVIVFAGSPIHHRRNGQVTTFLESGRMASTVAAGKPLEFDLVCDGGRIGGFKVDVEQSAGR